MNIKKIHDFANLKDIVLIGSLPDMGKVGGIVSEFLAKKLQTKTAAKIIMTDKPWVNQKNGLISLPQDEYFLSVNEENAIVIFTGQNQPQEPASVFEMTQHVLSKIKQMGNIKMIISAGGYLPGEHKDGTGVYGVATNAGLLEMLKSHNICPLGSEVNSITWFNGLILGHAKNQNIDGIGLFGEIVDVDAPQYKAASNIINTIAKILRIKIDTSELDEKGIEVTTDTQKEGPGIG